MIVRTIAQCATIALASWILAIPPVSAASYEEARDHSDSNLSFEQRITTQVLLDAAGFAPVVPMAHLSRQAYQAVLAFEDANGYTVSGIVTPPKIRRLAFESAAYLRYIGFSKVAYPGRQLAIWVPLGLGLDVARTPTGLHFRDWRGRLALDMVSFDGESIQVVHDRWIADERTHSATIHDDNFSVGDTWFAISSTWPGGSDHYYRFYQDSLRVTGFALEWNKTVEDINAEAIAAIMSGSLRSAISDEPFVEPPKVVTAPVTRER